MKLLNKKRLEMRKAYFLKSFNLPEEEMAIISFADCNFRCPYCKRDCQYITSDGNIIKTVDVNRTELKELIDENIIKNRRIRLSGGDPSAFPKESLEIAQYIFDKYGKKISVAHNGSMPNFIKMLLPYLKYIALDYKAFYKENLERITGIKNTPMNQEKIIKMCLENNIIVDVRTPIFGDTNIEELYEIGKIISKYPNIFWTLRKYNKVKGCNFIEPDMEYVQNMAIKLKKKFPFLRIGTRNYWKGGFEIF